MSNARKRLANGRFVSVPIEDIADELLPAKGKSRALALKQLAKVGAQFLASGTAKGHC